MRGKEQGGGPEWREDKGESGAFSIGVFPAKDVQCHQGLHFMGVQLDTPALIVKTADHLDGTGFGVQHCGHQNDGVRAKAFRPVKIKIQVF